MSDPATPPSPDGVPLLGNGYAFARDPLAAYERWAAAGDVVSLRFPGRRLYLVSDPDLIGTVLRDRDRFELSEAQLEVFAGLEDHAVTATRSEDWRRLRTALGPAFAREAIDRYAKGMVAATQAHVRRWDDGDRIDLCREMRLLSLRTLTNTLLDVDVGGREAVILDAADATVARADLRRPGQLLPDWIPTPTDGRFRRAVSDLDELVEDVLARRRADRDGGRRANGETDGRRPDRDGGDDPTDVAAVLFAAHERDELSLAELRDNLVAMILGGHDTAAVAFTYAWYLLDRHPDELDRLVQEYETVVGTGGTATDEGPTAADLDDLVHTRRVVDETLRLYPPAPVTARQTTESVALGGYRLPAGAQVLCPQWTCHRDDRFWSAPETFDPDRWAGETDRPEYAYFPFGGGPRRCIGAGFARQELILGLATMVGRVSLDVAAEEPLSLAPSLTLRPESELPATVRERGDR